MSCEFRIHSDSESLGRAAALALVDVQEEPLNNVCREIQVSGGQAVPIPADLTSAQGVGPIFKTILDTFGRLDILINNAGGGLPTDFFSITAEEWNRILTLNLTATFLLSQTAARIFRERGGGVIVNLSFPGGAIREPNRRGPLHRIQGRSPGPYPAHGQSSSEGQHSR